MGWLGRKPKQQEQDMAKLPIGPTSYTRTDPITGQLEISADGKTWYPYQPYSGGATGGTTWPGGTYIGDVSPIKPDPCWQSVEVALRNGRTESMNVDTQPSAMRALLDEAAKLGWLRLDDGASVLMLPMADVAAIRVTKLSTE